jgi:hypothetical protein
MIGPCHPPGEFLVRNGVSTFAISETQKFGHVTFFWNGNRSGYLDSKLEQYLEVREDTSEASFVDESCCVPTLEAVTLAWHVCALAGAALGGL